MTIPEIVEILANRLKSLETARQQAVAGGDLIKVATIDGEILETSASLERLSRV